MNLKKEIREIPDFPKEGISFKDITTLLKNKDAFNTVVDSIVDEFKDKSITKVVGLESRGFIFGGAVASKLNAGFVPIRKKGKLPAKVISETYELEYGEDSVEIHEDALGMQDIILIHDDLLATGGTAYAALNLAKKMGVRRTYFSFVCDLEFIDTPKKKEIKSFDPQILIKY
ncbi:adenine phosphoribosyltransferase [Maribellus maritimus]|uniref:adenine phosphoribosyltransferase n=1 Tax=Maribellus maritimus TaxID=2870838 RepID=UPI001EEAFCCA|nr:adenine phosphoribosyltransferase [Maribellus maritimus]MCG6190748.1 adenine phosphoribosyltransferase [Maribellus maritimus]